MIPADVQLKSVLIVLVFFSQAVPGSVGGGAIYVNGAGGFPRFTGCTFTQNVADSGGAMFVSSSILAIQDCLFDGNYAVQNGAGRGGAIMSAFNPTSCQQNFNSGWSMSF